MFVGNWKVAGKLCTHPKGHGSVLYTTEGHGAVPTVPIMTI